MRELWLVVAVVACGSSTPAPKPVVEREPVETKPVEDPQAAEKAEREREVTAHRKIEEEQQDALGATCTDPGKHEPRCKPSCYVPEAADPRSSAAKKVKGPVEIQHLVCQRPEGGPFMVIDVLDPKLAVKPARRFGKAHKKGWQADVEAAFKPELFVITGNWREVVQPLTKERLRCANASQFAVLKKPLDACGGTGDTLCEATGNAAAHGLDVIHYRLFEARTLQSSGDTDGCQKAALEAVAVARGMPRWRQYAKLNVGQWRENARYRTRFDGVLDEDTVFANAQSLGMDAEAVFATCGGAAGAPTTAEQEQSFHTCW
ncbi:MAG: hypothetical protein JO257_28025 [Deltaproteobacteria bacterium]|nr:hypothetical protein [Deltaproteobacteria bacterium]